MTKKQEYQKKYSKTEHGRAVRKAAWTRYLESIGGKRTEDYKSNRNKRYAEDDVFRASTKARQKAYRNTPAAKQKRADYERSIPGIAAVLFSKTNKNAKSRKTNSKMVVTITTQEIQERLHLNGLKCERTGDAFSIIPTGQSGGKNNPYAPSVDQIVPGEGYHSANIQIVTWWYNRLKGDSTDDETLAILHQWAYNNGYVKETKS